MNAQLDLFAATNQEREHVTVCVLVESTVPGEDPQWAELVEGELTDRVVKVIYQRSRTSARIATNRIRGVWRNHRCEACGATCDSTEHHVRCCGTESQHRNTVGSYCSGHPCPSCRQDPDGAP